MAVNFNKFKGAAAKEKLEAVASTPRESQGGGDIGYGVFDMTGAPSHVNRKWEPKEGKNLVMMVPLEVTNKMNPAFFSGAIDLGEYDYGVSVVIHHGKDTPAGLSHVCPKVNFGKPCPRCDEFFLPPEKGGTFVRGVKGSGNPLHAKSNRNYFIVVPFLNETTPDEDNTGLWNAPDNSKTGFQVIERAKDMVDGNGIIPFWWPTDEGRLVQFTAKKVGKYFEYSEIKFVKRPTALAEKLAEKYSFPLDSLLIVKTPDQINADIFGGPGHEETKDDDTQTQHSRTEPEEDGMDPDAFGAPEPEAAKEPEEAPEEKPRATPAPVASNAPEGGSKCPYGHAYGTDWGDTPDCKMCRRTHKDLEAVCADGGN